MRKRLGYSFLTVFLTVTLVMTSILCMLVLQVASRSVRNFEKFIVESKQQETNEAALSFEQDTNVLFKLMNMSLHHDAFNRLLLYLDSGLINYNYLENTKLLQSQMYAIENSHRLVDSAILYLPMYHRKITSGSLVSYEEEDTKWLSEALSNGWKLNFTKDGRLMLIHIGGNSSALLSANGAVVVCLSQTNMRNYLRQFAPVAGQTTMALYVQGEERMLSTSRANINSRFQQQISSLISTEERGSKQHTFDGTRYLLTWRSISELPLKLCQITPMALIDEQQQDYRNMIIMMCLVSVLLLAGLDTFMYIAIRNPILRMKNAMREVETGNLSVRIPPTWSKEFQHIFGQFNQMTERLQQLIEHEYQLKLLHVQAELKQMRYQISPHFLYNTYFNMRAMLLDEDYEAAERIAELMGRFLRYITVSVQDEATLRQEMEHSIAYLDIQKLRFGDRLETRVGEIPPGEENHLIPRIIIQPLIENAFEHGIKDRADKGIISVSVSVTENVLSVVVEDNGQRVTDEMIEKLQARLDLGKFDAEGESVALMNIQRRIQMLYEPGSGLYVSRSSLGGFRGEIRMIGEKKHVSNDDR